MTNEISEFNAAQLPQFAPICDVLLEMFNETLVDSTSKQYHRSPAWFIDDNPIVGYYIPVKNEYVRVMFWSGQSFDEPSLHAEGTFKAATIDYPTLESINKDELRRMLQTAINKQWDYKNIVKNKGVLHPLKGVTA